MHLCSLIIPQLFLCQDRALCEFMHWRTALCVLTRRNSMGEHCAYIRAVCQALLVGCVFQPLSGVRRVLLRRNEYAESLEPLRNRGRLSCFIAYYCTTYGARGDRSHDRPPCHGNQAGAGAATKYCTYSTRRHRNDRSGPRRYSNSRSMSIDNYSHHITTNHHHVA